MTWRRAVRSGDRAAGRKISHRLLVVGVSIKGADGLLEAVGGLLLLFVSPQRLNRLTLALTAHELSEDPRDRVAIFLRHAVHNLAPSTKLFASVYLLVHGLVKVVLVAGLLRDRRWAYPTALCFLGAFVLYQTYRFGHTHSVSLLGFTILDVFIIGLIGREYLQRNHADDRPPG